MATDTQERHTVGTPLSKEEYLEKVGKPQPGFTKTLDANDSSIGHTVGSENGIDTSSLRNDTPGQVFETWQLPDPQAALDAGLPPVAVPEHLIVDGDYADGNHPQGADILDLLTREQRKGLGNPRLDERGFTVADDVAGFEAKDDDSEVGQPDTTGSGLPKAASQAGSTGSQARTENGDTKPTPTS